MNTSKKVDGAPRVRERTRRMDIPHGLWADPKLSKPTKLVGTVLWSFRHATKGRAWMSLDTLAARLGGGRNTRAGCIRAIQKLKAAGYLLVDRGGVIEGHRVTSQYGFILGKWMGAEMHPSPKSQGAGTRRMGADSEQMGAETTRNGCGNDTQVGDRACETVGERVGERPRRFRDLGEEMDRREGRTLGDQVPALKRGFREVA